MRFPDCLYALITRIFQLYNGAEFNDSVNTRYSYSKPPMIPPYLKAKVQARNRLLPDWKLAYAPHQLIHQAVWAPYQTAQLRNCESHERTSDIQRSDLRPRLHYELAPACDGTKFGYLTLNESVLDPRRL